MRIMTRLNLLCLGVILAMTWAVLAAGSAILDGILHRAQGQVLHLELTNAQRSLVQTLNRSGTRAASRFAGEFQAALAQKEGLRSVQLFVIDGVGQRAVFHPAVAAGEEVVQAEIATMLARQDGEIDYESEGGARYAVFTTLHPLKWLIVLSVSQSEMLARKHDFLEAIAAITLASLGLNALAINLFGRRLLRRIDEALACVHRIERGELAARIPLQGPQDELRSLQEGINVMGDSLQARAAAQRDIEAALRLREARIRRLVEANIIGIFFWNLDGAILDANDAFLALLGYDRDDLAAGRLQWTTLTPPEYVPVDQRAREEVRQTGSCRPYEKAYFRKDGSRLPVLVGGALLEASESEGVAFVLDLSERKQAEADREARQAAEAASRAKSEFLSAMSHELRTPLNAILGYAQLLRREPGLARQQASGLETILQSGRHLLTLINDILDLAKIEAGRLELEPVPVAPAAFLAGVADIIRIEAEAKGLVFHCTIPPELPPGVLADEKRLRQVLLNLLGNAVKFTERGEISLLVTLARPAANPLPLRFEVADSGIGMERAQLERIFQPFEQVGDLRQRAGGTGLGLAISRQLVRLMGSDIAVDSRPDAGSRFWFELALPLADARWRPEAPLPAVAPTVAGNGRRRRILIADDVVSNRALFADLLGRLGFDHEQARNGAEAVERVRDDRPDLVLMDLRMPVMDGVTAIRHIRAESGAAGPPIIAISASADDAEQQAALTAGADAFLPKPFEESQLLGLLARLLGLAGEVAAGEPLPIPPPAVLAALHELALAGDMRGICAEAARLAAGDPRHAALAQRLEQLAQNYQSQAILALINAYLAGTPEG